MPSLAGGRWGRSSAGMIGRGQASARRPPGRKASRRRSASAWVPSSPVIWWGKDLSVLYNDAYIPILGPQKHPMFLGRPAKEQWPEIWDVVGTAALHVISTGEATWSEDQ